MPQHFALAAAQHQRTRIIVKAGEGHTAKVTKRALVAVEQRGQPLIAIPAGKQTPRIAQREHEQVDRLRLLTDPDLQLTIIDLRLFAGRGLKPHGRDFLPTATITPWLQQTLHVLIAAVEAQPNQLSMQDHSIPTHFWSSSLDKREVRIERARPLAAVPRLPAAESQPAPYRLPIHREFPRDLSRTFAPLPPRHHHPHQVCTQHLPLRRRSRGCRRKSYSFQTLFHVLLLLTQVGEFQMIISGGDSHDC